MFMDYEDHLLVPQLGQSVGEAALGGWAPYIPIICFTSFWNYGKEYGDLGDWNEHESDLKD